MKSFLVLLDENQLSLSEQKQVYEKIKEDYERLMKEIDQNKRDTDLDRLII
jgi:alpha-mannosidase